ncbi:MAG TPA: carboxypeptidase regulatory-like domain-containing protein [Pyrinomonadaceae bacterium]
MNKRIRQCLGLALMLALSIVSAVAQQGPGSIRGQVTDEFGGAVVGATVSVINQSGVEKTATTNEEGIYVVTGLAPGAYTVRVVASGFAINETPDVQITAGKREALDVKLGVTIEEQKVNVTTDQRGISTESENNADAIVLRGKDLDALPDDPDDLAAALSALAGPSVGPNGGQIYIDGFTGGRLPPKEAIREVRVSQNPLNAENDRPGFGRIDILTRPGYDRWRGSVNLNFNDESMNARNPFAPTRDSFQSRLYGFTLSGPVSAKKSSFFLDFQRREINDNDVVNALVLDPSLNTVRFNETILQPRRFLTFSPRFDYAINQNHTVVARYTYSHFTLENSGVGNFNLPSRAFNTENTQHTFQITETAVLNPKTINETRFQYIRSSNQQEGDNAVPTIQVLEAFTGGGSQVGLSFNRENRWELQNYTTATWIQNHTFRFGVRLRGVKISDVSRNNFGGSFTFAGGLAPQLDANNNIVLVNGQPVLSNITSLDRYRRTILLQQQGFTPTQVFARGGGPTQFTLSGGTPEADVSQMDFGGFFQDEWRVRPNLTLTLGLRYETQSNISSRFNFAPRLFFAWAPGGNTTGQLGQFGAGQPAFVIRGGFGIFYDRFTESNTLSANRFNGVNQLRFNIVDPAILGISTFNADGTVTNVPTVDALSGLAQPQVINRVSEELQAPYTMISAINAERQLPYNITVFALLVSIRQRQNLVFRDINAPLPGTVTALNPGGTRPDPTLGNVFQWESAGYFNMTQFMAGMRTQLNPGLTIFANYFTAKTESNTDCVFGIQGGCFPSNPYDINADRGRIPFIPRHNFFLGGTLGIPKLKIALNPFIIARTGNFFNITTGRDTNGDRIFRERPAFADGQTLPQDLRSTAFGDFDINPKPGQTIIPRNYGVGPGFFSVNLGISRTFGFGEMPGARAAAAAAAAPQGGGGANIAGGARGGGGGAPRGGGGGGAQRGGGGGAVAAGPGGAGAEKRYNLTFSVNIQNLFNRTNLSSPVGNLNSPFFGQSLSTLGGFGDGGGNASSANRRISAGVRFNF